MAFRFYDWECGVCSARREALLWVDGGSEPDKRTKLRCDKCGRITTHTRLVSLPAPYTGEQVHNPMVTGGRYDTMGHEPMPDVPTNRHLAEHQARCSAALASLPDSLSPQERHRAVCAAVGSSPNVCDIQSHYNKPEVKEVLAERNKIKQRNKQKRARAAALASGAPVNMRRDRCPGDPKI